MAAIRKALIDGEAEALAREAHTLKGAVGNFGVAEIADAARDLEMRAREGNMLSARTAHAALDEKLASFTEALRAAAARSTGKLFPAGPVPSPAGAASPEARASQNTARGDQARRYQEKPFAKIAESFFKEERQNKAQTAEKAMTTIMVAEDDATTSHLLQGVLEAAGYTVRTVTDGDAALKQLRKKPVDLLITDIWMPRVNGLELLARLKKEPPPHPRVIVMTSDDTPETLLQAVREQAYQYLRKPVEPKTLVDLVRDTLAADPLALPIEVISARPDWVELLVPCDLATAERITAFMNHLRADLPEEVRERVGPGLS